MDFKYETLLLSHTYRVTIPAVIQIAALRQKYLYESQAAEVEFN
ncbi:hypothetical protein ALT1644_650006 [Alteromonas macleodii]